MGHTNQILCCSNFGASHPALSWNPALVLKPPQVQQGLLMLPLLLCLLQEVKSWQGDDSPVANGAGAAFHHQRDKEPGKDERKEEEKLKASQVGAGPWCVGWTGLGGN
jgi:hypothetical protein